MNKNSNAMLHDEIQIVDSLCSNTDTEGFDLEAGETWIYPTNYSFRDYQYNIIQEVLFKNTMVSLPTGLGKTFIAAVVMYNFYRWYPMGKIIFMAPTKPLVKQQMDACYNIMAIPKNVTVELTGTKVQLSRKEVWKDKRVFFITPQILQNDLNILSELGSKIKCLVFDEAHKAKKNYAYCEIIRKLISQNKYFRVLALSATPGNSLPDVLEIIKNLLISHLEVRTDNSPDIMPYIFERTLSTIVIPLDGKLQQVRDDYLQILEKYTRVLVQHRVITGNCSTLTKGRIFMTMKAFQEKNVQNRNGAYSEIMKNLNICVTLYHAFELLIRHGLRGFLTFFEEHINNPLLKMNTDLQRIMEDVREYLGPAPVVEQLPDGSILEISESSKFGHPKFYKLRDIISDHFKKKANNESRVIVFCEYRESVMEAYALLLSSRPLIKPKFFLGKSSITQKQQIHVIKAFRQGECNTLISTSIGEEGLDVGEVDLIVCFDINTKSPIRMVQRIGRTGRKREGQVIVLVTEGKEEQTLKECLIHKKNLTNHILQSNQLYKEMYKENPRMVPKDIIPKCQKMYITVSSNCSQFNNKTSNSLKNIFNISKKNSNMVPFAEDDVNVTEIKDLIPSRQEYWNKSNPLQIETDKSTINFSKQIERNRVLQPIEVIGHSKISNQLVSLLQFSETSKYNISLSQLPITSSQINPEHKIYKQTNIKDAFCKSSNGELKLSLETRRIEDNINKDALQASDRRIISYLAEITTDSSCNVCENLFDCFEHINLTDNKVNWTQVNYITFDSINDRNLKLFEDSLNVQLNCDVIKNTTMMKENHIEKDTFSLNDMPLENIYNQFNMNSSLFDNIKFTQVEEISKLNQIKETLTGPSKSPKIQQLASTNMNNTLSFFNLTEIEDIFEENKIASNKLELDSDPGSPILSSFQKVRKIKNNINKPSFDDFKSDGCNESRSLDDEIKKTDKLNSSNAYDLDIIDTSIEIFSQPKVSITDVCITARDLNNFNIKEDMIKNKNVIEPTKCIDQTSLEKNKVFNCPKTSSVLSDFYDSSLLNMIFDSNTFPANSKNELKPNKATALNISPAKHIKNETSNKQNILDKSESDSMEFDDDFCISWRKQPISKSNNLIATQSKEVNSEETTRITNKTDLHIDNLKLTSSTQEECSKLDTSPNKSPTLINFNMSLKSTSKRTISQTKIMTRENNLNELDTLPKSIIDDKGNCSKLDNSEDDIVLSPVLSGTENFKSNLATKKIKNSHVLITDSSDDDFELPKHLHLFKKSTATNNTRKCRKTRRKTDKHNYVKGIEDCHYLDLEAEVSVNENNNHSFDFGDEEEQDNSFEKSFVDDETENIGNNTNMHAHYLKSVRSPIKNRGAFKIPKLLKPMFNIFSQVVETEDSYVNDSFCVNTEDIELSQQSQELTELELAELLLEEKCKNRKEERRNENKIKKRKHRIIESSSDSND